MASLNLENRTLEALDWPWVLAALAERTRTGPGRAGALALEPATDAEAVRGLHDAIDELSLLHEEEGSGPPLGRIDDVRGELGRAARGQTLDLEELRRLADTVGGLDELARFVEAAATRAPTLHRRSRGLRVDAALARKLASAFDAEGRLSQTTYPRLAELRARIAGFERRIRSELERLLQSDELADVLQDSYVTMRGDRFVVPVRAQAKNLGLGIVHDASRTGQTVYVEPSAIVPLGNERRMTEAALVAEEQRILRELSGEVAEHATSLEVALDRAVEIDLINARHELAAALDASRPHVGSAGVVQLRGARHAVLTLAGIDVVPNDLSVSAEVPVLVLTGPNAGGKTVALKTIGLCVALVRAGCFVPADRGSRVDWFDAVLADIGDQQTVHEGLSSFSAHLTTLREMLSVARPGVLLLLDEIASGTDPTQGGALARALIERFSEAGARVVVTTHYAQVKAMAAADHRVGVSAMEYADGRPTYRIVSGLAGESHALSAAEHVGLDTELIARARALMDEGERALGDALAELERERERSRSLTRRVERMATDLEARERTVAEREERQRAGARKLEREAAAEFTERVRGAEREVRRIVAELQRAPSPRAAETARRRLADACENIAAALAENEPPKTSMPPSVGDRVQLRSLGTSGEVIAIDGGKLQVRVGGMVVHIEEAEAERVGGPVRSEPAANAGARSATGRDRRKGGRMQPDATTPDAAASAVRYDANTLDLRGVRVGEGLRLLEEFLDAAVLAGHDSVFVLHGHGTGAMKTAVRDALRQSPYVEDSRPAEPEQGGDALTVARLRP